MCSRFPVSLLCAFVALAVAHSYALATTASPIGPEAQANTTTTNGQTAPAAAMDSAGNYAVAWVSTHGFVPHVYAQRFDFTGATVGGELQVSSAPTASTSHPSIAMDDAGNFVVAWHTNQVGFNYIYAQRFDGAGAQVGSEFLVNTGTGSNHELPSVAMSAAGDFVIVWHSNQAGDTRVYGQMYASTGVAVGSQFQVNTSTTNEQREPSIAIDGSGNFVVAWQSNHIGDNRVYIQRYGNTGTPVGAEVQVNTTTTNAQAFPTVAMAPSGDFVVAWQSDQTSDQRIYAQLIDRSGAFVGSEFQVNSTATATQARPAAAMDESGRFVIVWEGDQTIDSRVYARGFDQAGTAVGSEVQVNSTTTNDQSRPAIGMRRGGSNYVVAWESDQTTDLRIYGQLYDDLPRVTLSTAAPDPTSVPTVAVTAAFSEAVTGFVAGDIRVNGTGGLGVSNLAGGPATYTFDVTWPIAGVNTIDIQAGVATGSGAGLNLASNVLTRTYNVAPTVTIDQGAAQPDPTTTGPIVFDVTFSESVTGFDGSDVNLTASTVAGTLVAGVSGTGAAYTVSVSGMIGTGTVVATINAGAAQNGGGVGNVASTSMDNTVTFNGGVGGGSSGGGCCRSDPNGSSATDLWAMLLALTVVVVARRRVMPANARG